MKFIIILMLVLVLSGCTLVYVPEVYKCNVKANLTFRQEDKTYLDRTTLSYWSVIANTNGTDKGIYKINAEWVDSSLLIKAHSNDTITNLQIITRNKNQTKNIWFLRNGSIEESVHPSVFSYWTMVINKHDIVWC